MGSSYTQISDHIEEIYSVGFSKATISAVTDKILPMLQELKVRPLEEIYPFLFLDAIHYKVRENGFLEAINTVFPNTQVQLCIVHQIRNSLKFIASKDQKQFAKELKAVYQAFTKEEAELELDKLEGKWGKSYSIVFKSWRSKWDNLTVNSQYQEDIRRVIYTSNIVESVHRQFRTLTKTKTPFPNDDSLLKLLFMGIQNAWVFKMHRKNRQCRYGTGA